MCAYFELKGGRYIYANTWGASVYDSEDGHQLDIIQLDNPDTQEVAHLVAKWIKANN